LLLLAGVVAELVITVAGEVLVVCCKGLYQLYLYQQTIL
jgi:hypothetical protein